jgi:hypothetical protein
MSKTSTMEISKQHKINILCNQASTIGYLECLLLQNHQLERRTEDECIKYRELLTSGELFTREIFTQVHGILQFLGPGNEIKKKCLDWMVLYTFDAATALHMAHLAKQVSNYIYKTIVKYLEEISPSSQVVSENMEEVEKPPQDVLDNPRRKKKREIKYEDLLRELLDGTRYSDLYPMLLSAYQMTYIEKPKKETNTANQPMGWKKSDIPLSKKTIPIYHCTDKHGVLSIFNEPLHPDLIIESAEESTSLEKEAVEQEAVDSSDKKPTKKRKQMLVNELEKNVLLQSNKKRNG